MSYTVLMEPYFFARFVRRLSRYSVVGISTFTVDLAIVYALVTYLSVDTGTALASGFLIGVTINYIASYYWTYRGTKRDREVGYAIFIAFALLCALIIVATVGVLVSFGANFYVARVVVALCIGFLNFILNTFFNFKLL